MTCENRCRVAFRLRGRSASERLPFAVRDAVVVPRDPACPAESRLSPQQCSCCLSHARRGRGSCTLPAQPYSARHARRHSRSRLRQAAPRDARGGRDVRRRRLVGHRRPAGRGRLRGRRHHAAALCGGRAARAARRLLRRGGHLRRPPGGRPARHPPLRARLRGALPRGGDRGFCRLLPARRDADPLRALQRASEVPRPAGPRSRSGGRCARHRPLRAACRRAGGHGTAPGGRPGARPELLPLRYHAGAARVPALPPRRHAEGAGAGAG